MLPQAEAAGLAAVYAAALDEAARRAEARAPEAARIGEELAAFVELWRREARVREFLLSPGVSLEAKQAAVRRGLLAASGELVNLLLVLLERRRLGLLEELAREFARRRAEAEGLVEAQVLLAAPPPAELEERIRAAVSRRTGKRVRLTVTVRPEFLGGLVVRVGGERLDGSLQSRLAGVRRGLLAARSGGRLWAE